MAALLADRNDILLVIPGSARPPPMWPRPATTRNFYLWGAMGGAAMMGLGLARAQPATRSPVLTGDGEVLMGLGWLATIGFAAPANPAVVVFDNGEYGETGMQPSHTQSGVDLACRGWPAAESRTCLDVRDEAAAGRTLRRGLKDLRGDPVCACADRGPASRRAYLPERDGVVPQTAVPRCY